MDIQLAWRNIWRNPRRTAVILTAVIIGVWSMIFLGALMRGMVSDMIANGISTLTGEIQIHRTGYRTDPSIDHRFTADERMAAILQQTLPEGSRWSERIRVEAVATNARHAAGVTLVGMDPGAERHLSFIGDAVRSGGNLKPEDRRGILIGEALRDTFETRIGQKLVLMAPDAHGDLASRAFRITGVFEAEMEATEKQFVFITLPAAQQMLQVGSDISEIALTMGGRADVDEAAASLKERLPAAEYEIHTWLELLPLLRTYLEMYDGWVLIWFIMVFVAMGFGLVNTTLMAVFERMREFGLMKAMGMKPLRIVRMVLIESGFILLVGSAAGNLLGVCCAWLLAEKGIDISGLASGAEFAGISRVIYPRFAVRDVVTANLVVIVLGLLVSLYPALKAARITPVEALAHT